MIATLAILLCLSHGSTSAGDNPSAGVDSVYADTLRTGAGSIRHADAVYADTLRDVVVKGQRRLPTIEQSQDGTLRWSTQMLNDLPKILGNADPMRYTQTLPGIQTNNEYDAGLHIFGCDNQHNYVSLNGVPVFNANHLMGLFSTFNPTHFTTMELTRSATEASFPNRLGGMLNMVTTSEATVPGSFAAGSTTSGSLSVGLISSQGTLRMPLGNRSSIVLSGRISYLNQLYSYALKADDAQFRYDFGDLNATFFHAPTERDLITIDLYHGSDNLDVAESSYFSKDNLKWGNTILSASWLHQYRNAATIRHTLYYSEYHNRLTMVMEGLNGRLSSSVRECGYRMKYTSKRLSYGLDAMLHAIVPQHAIVTGSYNSVSNTVPGRQYSVETSAFANYCLPLGRALELTAGLRETMYDCDGWTTFVSDPSVTIANVRKTDYTEALEWSLTLSSRHQFMSLSGFSSIGLPVEAWRMADRSNPCQSSLNVFADAGRGFMDGNWRLTAELYYKYLRNQSEYHGSVYDFLATDYSSTDHLFLDNGHNYGINIMLTKQKGRLRGWIAYNFGRALRSYSSSRQSAGATASSPSVTGASSTYPSSHERIHELNILATLRLGNRWTLGATYVLASGTPITVPEYFYIAGGTLLAQYSEHNAFRLKPYSRLDLSANYLFKTRHARESGINISVYNALMHSNQLFYTWRYDQSTNTFAYRPVSFLISIIPSISYYVNF